jgi:hypothetical protein
VGCEVLRMVRFIQIYTMEDWQHKLLVHLKYAESVYSTVHWCMKLEVADCGEPRYDVGKMLRADSEGMQRNVKNSAAYC